MAKRMPVAAGGGWAAPDPVSDLAAAADAGGIVLSWTEAFGATGYDIQRSLTNGNFSTIATDQTGATYYDSSGDPNTPYYYRIIAKRNQVPSLPSNVASATTVNVFSPIDLSPMIWLDASQLGLANDDPVAEFTDYSGNARHFVQSTAGNKPLFKSAGINSLGAVEGDGTDDFMTLAAFGGQASWYGFIVFRPITMGASKDIWGISDYPASDPEYQMLETNSGTTININQSAGPLSPSLTIANNTNYAFLVKGTATTMHIYSSTSDIAALTGLAGTTPNWGSRANWGMRLFNRGDGACPFNVRIGEFVFNSGTITGDPEVQLWEYANAKWGTPVPTFTP